MEMDRMGTKSTKSTAAVLIVIRDKSGLYANGVLLGDKNAAPSLVMCDWEPAPYVKNRAGDEIVGVRAVVVSSNVDAIPVGAAGEAVSNAGTFTVARTLRGLLDACGIDGDAMIPERERTAAPSKPRKGSGRANDAKHGPVTVRKAAPAPVAPAPAPALTAAFAAPAPAPRGASGFCGSCGAPRTGTAFCTGCGAINQTL